MTPRLRHSIAVGGLLVIAGAADCITVVPAHGVPGWPAGAFTPAPNAIKVSYQSTPRPWIIGHRGAGEGQESAPYAENTIPAMQEAIVNRGAVGVEIDVQMTSDGQPLVIRGPRMSLTTRCTQCVSSITLAEAQTCAVYAPGPPIYPPTLSDALAAMVKLPVAPLVLITGRPDGEDDCAPSVPEANTDPAETLGHLIGNAIASAGATAFAGVIGREALVLAARTDADGILTFTNSGTVQNEVTMAGTFNLSGIVVESKNLYNGPLANAASASLLVEAWDINTPVDIVSAVAHDVAIIETSRIPLVKESF